MREQALEALRACFEEISAVEVADLLLSPFIAPELLNASTADAGPSLWIVNRSDVYDATLETLIHHPLSDIAARARVKLESRASRWHTLPSPRIEGPLEQIPDSTVEDLLGHPLVPWEAVLFFARSLNEDHRASAALSLTRRLLEYPPDWLPGDHLAERLQNAFAGLLLNDASPFARAYAARVPLLKAADLAQAIDRETHPFVYGRLLQNPAMPLELLNRASERMFRDPAPQNEFALRVLAFDARLPVAIRSRLQELSQATGDPLSEATNNWYLFAGTL